MTKDRFMKEEISHNNTLIVDLRKIIDEGRREAYSAVNQSIIRTYWKIGERIVEEEQHGESRAAYGSNLLSTLAEQLTKEYGKGFSRRNLNDYRLFYLQFRDLDIWRTRLPNLTWSHYLVIMRESSPEGRAWYIKEASEQMWSVRTLERNVTTQYYGRMLASQRERTSLPKPEKEKEDPLEYIKNPIVAEFMGFKRDTAFTESELEQALIDNLEKFILELGRGFAFVERQQRVSTASEDFYIDLVFYNFKMKRFVIFELKTHKLTHADIGQLDMYVRMYDDLVKGEDDNPTIGILLCTETDNVIAKYSVLNESDQLFATKYMAYMPTEEELRREIEQQKRYFMEHHAKN